MSSLKPCPFCGASGDQLGFVGRSMSVLGTGETIDYCAVHCHACGAESTTTPTGEEAVEAWLLKPGS